MGTVLGDQDVQGKPYESSWPIVGDRNSWTIGIIGRLDRCGLNQGWEILVCRSQIPKSWHVMPKSLNFALQTLGVVEKEVR